MAKYSTKNDLFKATDEEISAFFREVKFTGVFDTEIPEEHKSAFCGKVTNIVIDGELNKLCPLSLYVPIKFMLNIGACEFACSVNLNLLRSEKQNYKLHINRIKNITIKEKKSFDSGEEFLVIRNLRLRNNQFVGLFTQNKDGSFSVWDIRRSDFSKLILQNGKEQQPIVYFPKVQKPLNGKYYEFSWILNDARKEEYVYLFEVDETKPYEEVSARNVIDKIHNSRMDYSADGGQMIVKMLDTLKNQLTASGKEIFIYELLQNANDYPYAVKYIKEMVDVEFHITRDSLLFLHSGAEFNERNIAAICSINDKEKTDNKETIGYKGIGFKTVFLDNHYVYLQSGGFSFRFDKEVTRDIVDTPWQILPTWTMFSELTSTERYIFTNVDKKFRVKFALRPTNHKTLRDSGQNYVKMFKEVFSNERVILFIPNLSSVKVFYNGRTEPDLQCLCDNNRWQVNNYEDEVPNEITESINSDIGDQEDSGVLKIPTKYYDFTKTKVSFACEIDGSILKEVEDAQLYCYLPTKASWGFKFLMNTDMIPTGPRDDIEIDFSDQVNINEEIAEIAGSKFFDWLKDLCELKKYKVNSIFSLIPVFETNISQHGKYKDLIERFKSGFDARVETDELIPIDSNRYELVKNIILDETGLMASGIMDDKDFFKITGDQGALPVKVLRNDREFKAFLRRYLKILNCENNIWGFKDLKELCTDSDFKEWVSIQNNNNFFLEFLLKEDELKNFIEEDIFIQEGTGDLTNANALYYDVDEHLIDLKEFDEHIPHLSIATREFFKDNSEWRKVIETEFSEFNPEDFVNDKLLSVNEFKYTSQKLHTKATSLCFYKFLAKNEIEVTEEIKSLPFFNDNNKSVDGFEDAILFFSSRLGPEVASYDWLNNVSIEFVSSDYEKIVLEYFRNNLNVQDFSDEIIIKDIILSDDYHDDIVDAIADDFDTSKAFVDYCYIHKDMFNSGDLRNYTLKVFEGEGDTSWCLSEDHIFFSSSIYDDYSAKEWIDSDWMYVLDKDYYTDQKDLNDYKKFLSQKFWITELDEKNFYKDVVSKNFKNIISNINGSNDSNVHKNIDFIKYLDDNYHLIFEEEKDSDAFLGLVLVDKDTSVVDVNTENLYIYNDELVSIFENDWFPKNLVTLCNSGYRQSKALIAIGVKNYKFGEFFDDVIVAELSSINKNIDVKEKSISFHNFIIEHLNVLTPDQQSKMLNSKVFLYGQDVAADTAGGHKTLSSKAKELFDKGLVEFSDLDIIDPDYKTEKNVEYWESRLGNTKFTINHFFTWLKDNADTFSDTLQEEELNIEFWRWLKDNVADKLIEEASSLPILLKDSSFDSSDEPVYFCDEYMEGAGIEHSVKIFDKDALFISPNYIEENDNIEEWKTFWEKVGVKHEIVDILVETVIPRLSEIDDENLPKLLSGNRESLEKCYEDGLISQLTNLRVKAHDGEYYDISETIYIDCEKIEPFPYIKLPNQISYNSAEERRLIKDIIDEIDGDCVSTLSEWQQRKLDCYIAMQSKNCESVRDFHFKFINDLSIIRNNERTVLKDIERLNEIFLLNRDDEFCKASTLTKGSVYNPFFDFEGCGVNSLDYVSDSYNTECTEYVGKLFRAIDVHCDFIEDNIHFLKDRECSIYFWSEYLTITKKDVLIYRIKRIQQYISDKLLDNLACIPTKDYMKTPKELYFGDEVSRYVKAIEDWENKVPLIDLPDIKTSNNLSLFSELQFKDSLDFLDALYALVSIPGQERRKQLLEWMIDDYDDIFNEKIQKYREEEHAQWYNNMNEKVHINKLYALDYYDKTLEQYFGTNSRIVNKQYFPTGDSFKEACDILGIKIITAQDLKMEPVDESIYTERDTDLKLFALVIAGIADYENWQSLYEGYCEKLSVLTLHNCSSILITYNEDDTINQSLRKFYHQDESNDFYFVKSLDNKRVYTLFVSEYMKFINIDEVDVVQELVEDIMDSRENALEIIKEQNTLKLDDDFKNELEKLCPGIKRELSGKKAEDENEEEIVIRPIFTTNPNQNDSEENIEDKENENTIVKIDANTEISQEENTEEDSNEFDFTHVSQDSADKTNARTPTSSISKENINYDTDKNSNHTGAGSDSISKEPRKTGSDDNDYDTSDDDEYIGSVDKNRDYEPIGRTSSAPRTRNAPKPFTKEELNRLRSNGSPLELESLPATEDEINFLAQYSISREQIADTNYLAQLRLYNNITEALNEEPAESLEDFIKNSADVSTHALKSGRYIHACSAARGVMYASPSVWNKMVDDKWIICVYLDGQGKNFHYINSADEFLELVEKDDVVIKITGKDKVNIVNKLYSGLLGGVKGSAYTLIRVAARTNMDAVFAHYIGSMAEKEDGNEDKEEY